MDVKFIILAAIIFEVAVSIPVKTSLAQESNNGYIRNDDGSVGIFGGRNITIEKARYVGKVVRGKYLEVVATAVILNSRWIITNAFTIAKYLQDDLYIQVGTNIVALDPAVKWTFQKTFIHPKYNTTGLDNDIALAKLVNPLKFSKKVGSISIASKLPENGAVGLLTAYGMTRNRSYGFLQQLASPITHYDECRKRMPTDFRKYVSELHFCTIQDTKGPCRFDEGAPLVYKNKVVGIYADTFSCNNLPSLHNDMSKFKKWVDDTIKQNTEEGETLEYDEDPFDDEE